MKFTSEDFIKRQIIESPYTFNNGIKTIWFDQPYHLYFEEIQSKTYLEMITGEKFSQLLHEPTQQLIEERKKDIIENLKGQIELYDLGPGLPTKTIPLLRELKLQNKSFKYFPVDISNSFLKIAEKEIEKEGITSNPLNCFFEDLNSKIDFNNSINKIFLIGLTFNNYRPDKILSLLKNLCKPNGTCIIITEFFTSKNKETMLVPYKDKYAETFNYLVLKIAGVDKSDLSYFTEYKNQRIEMGFKLLNNIIIDGIEIVKGTKIVTAISYRYSKQALIKYISDYFTHFEIYQSEKHNISLVIFKLFEK
jgi:uncharacterized SAM-dependent methyltransferase